MSYDEGSFFNRFGCFIFIFVLVAPLFGIGYYKNGEIQKYVKRGLDELKILDFDSADKNFSKAKDQFGVLYQGYLLVLQASGGEFYDEKAITKLRGVTHLGAIARKMGDGDTGMGEELKVAKQELGTDAGIKAAVALGFIADVEKEAIMMEKLIPLMAAVKKGDHAKALSEFKELNKNNEKVLKGQFAGFPSCFVLSECAKALPDPENVSMAKRVVLHLALGNPKEEFFQKTANKVRSLEK